MNLRQIQSFGCAALALLTMLAMLASPARADEKDDLKDRFMARYPALLALKDAGKIGETWKGLVEAVNGGLTGEETALVAAENKDRTRLYEILAKELGAPADQVAQRNALRNFTNAAKGHYLKGKDDKWVQKS